MTLRVALLAGVAGCATMNTARPLAPGEHALGVVAGGGMVNLGGAPLPLPNVIVEGRHGVADPGGHPIDVGWGVNGTALAFGMAALHGGAAALIVKPDGAVPAVSVADRVWFATNLPGLGSKVEPKPAAWIADQLEVTASWDRRGQLGYVALAQYFDFGNPRLTLSPALGGVFDLREPGGVVVQVEARYYGVTVADRATTVDWIPGGRGVLGLSVGLSSRFGRPR